MTRKERALRNLKQMCSDGRYLGSGSYIHLEVLEDFSTAIKALEQEPKTGHWIATGAYYTGAYDSIDYVECSCCHYESLEEGDFCPNCGAKMVEPQKSEG